METGQRRLIDEARGEPVKNAFRLGLEFMDRNRLLAAMTMGIFVVLSLLDAVPGLGLLAGIALGVFAQSIQIYVGRTFHAAGDIGVFVEGAEQAKLKTFLTRYAAPAFGAWTGWFILSLAFLFIFGMLVVAAGLDPSMLEQDAIQNEADAIALLMTLAEAGIPLMLVALALTYVYPIAQGRVILSETFGEAFKSVFSVFTPSVWSAAMQKEYFVYLFFFSLAVIGIILLVGIAMALLIMIPILGAILAVVWIVFLMYVFNLVMGIANTIAREIAEGSAD